ncbi:MAG: hypothetical protein ABSH56_30435 [Bryobacteraceae bacterium]|jgi:hypothetical protein
MARLATNKGNGARAAVGRLADLHDKIASLDGASLAGPLRIEVSDERFYVRDCRSRLS